MRASAGYFIANNNTMKIQKLDEHAGMTMAGGVADAFHTRVVLLFARERGHFGDPGTGSGTDSPYRAQKGTYNLLVEWSK